MLVPFFGKFQFLNAILDQFMDCTFIIHHYIQFTNWSKIAFKNQNKGEKIISTTFFWFTIDAPYFMGGVIVMATTVFSGNHDLITAPLVVKLEKEAMAALIGVQWRHVETIFTKFKLFNAILVQFVDCHVCITIYYGIAIHKLVQNYI